MAKTETPRIVPAVSVVALQDSRWRAGRMFTREAAVIPLADLSEAEAEAIASDPLLQASPAEIELEDASGDPAADAAAAEKAAAEKAAADKK